MIIPMVWPFANDHPDEPPFANDHPDVFLSTRFFSIFISIFSKFLIFLRQTSSSPSKHFFFFKYHDQGSISRTFLEQCVLVLATTILPPHLLLAKDIMPSTRKRQSSSSRVLSFTLISKLTLLYVSLTHPYCFWESW